MASTKAKNKFLRTHHGITPETMAASLWATDSVRLRMIGIAKKHHPYGNGNDAIGFVRSVDGEMIVANVYRDVAVRAIRGPGGTAMPAGSLLTREMAAEVLYDWLCVMAPPDEVMACVALLMMDEAKGAKREKPRVPGVSG